MRGLILSCSDRKSADPNPRPALERYDGPVFRIVRRYLRDHPGALGHSLEVAIISAQYGLIWPETELPPYDRRMTRTRAQELQREIVPTMRDWAASHAQGEIFMMLGKNYQPAVQPIHSWLPIHAKLIVSVGGSGKQQSQLARWLDHRPPPANSAEEQASTPPLVPLGRAVVRGKTIIATPLEIEGMVQKWLAEGDEGYQRSQRWLAQVGPFQAAPKWLVSRLSGVPVSGFAADEARRALTQLGIPLVLR